MKILLIITRGDTIGGAQTHVLLLAKHLKLLGIKVLVIFGCAKTGPFEILLEKEDIPFLRIMELNNKSVSIYDILVLIKVAKVINNFKPDVVSLHSTKVGLLCRVLSPFCKGSFILTVHGWSFAEGIQKRRATISIFLERLLNRLIDHYILVSKYDYDLAKKMKIAKYSKFTIINNFLDIIDSSECTEEPYSEGGILKIIMVARFDKQKDQATLIKACSDLPFVELNLVGDGPSLQQMIALSKELNAKCVINFLGLRTDVDYLLRQHNLFVLTSNWEGFPISTLEAMRLGLPVIVSNVGGAAECVKTGVNGYIIKAGDVGELRNKIKHLADNPDLLREMSINARSHFELNYSSIIKVPEIINVFQTV